MELIRRLSSMREDIGLLKVVSTYFWSNILTLPRGDRYQVNINTYLRCLSMPKEPIGTILILQGGARHMASNSYYIRTACLFIPTEIRIFLFEKLLPMVNFEFTHDLAEAISLLRKQFPGPLVIIGYSMGGMLLWSYLGQGYDQGDLYIPTCCPLDLNHFRETIKTHPIFKLEEKRTLRSYQVDDYEGLLKFAGTSSQEQRIYTDHFVEGLNQYRDNWLKKTIYLLSSEDPLTKISHLELLTEAPLTYVVKGGWHCCLDSIYLSVVLASNYLLARSQGVNLEPHEIPTDGPVTSLVSLIRSKKI